MIIRSEWGGTKSRPTKRRLSRRSGEEETGYHKFKQQLTFKVKVCGNEPLATLYLYRRERMERSAVRLGRREKDSRAA